jgi:hypothetical protein
LPWKLAKTKVILLDLISNRSNCLLSLWYLISNRSNCFDFSTSYSTRYAAKLNLQSHHSFISIFWVDFSFQFIWISVFNSSDLSWFD